MTSEATVARFSGHYEEHDGVWFAVCAELPIVGCGNSRQAALRDAGAGIRVFIEDLKARDELRDAIGEGLIPSLTVDLAGSVPRIKATSGDWHAVAAGADRWILSAPELLSD
jgi:hypothetical protein